jgi:hypothetical protein
VAFVRHPLLRAHSVYQFTRLDRNQPFSDVARHADFAAYLRWVLRGEPGSVVVRNYQVVHLSDASWRTDHILKAKATDADLRQACALLSDWGVAGVVEAFDLSVRVMQAAYGPKIPGLKLTACWENATCQDETPWQHQVAILKASIGDELFEAFMQANALDLTLHAHAFKVLHRAAGQVEREARLPASAQNH